MPSPGNDSLEGMADAGPRGPSLSFSFVTLSTGFVDLVRGPQAGRGLSRHLCFLVEMQTCRGQRGDWLGDPMSHEELRGCCAADGRTVGLRD